MLRPVGDARISPHEKAPGSASFRGCSGGGGRNSRIRVYLVEVPPGGATALHYHRYDYVNVMLGDCELLNAVEGKPAVTTKPQKGLTRFVEGNFAHVVRDVGSTPFRNVTVEFLQDAKMKRSPPPRWEEERGLQVLEGGTQDILFVKDGVRVSEIDLQPHGMIPKDQRAVLRLVVAITDLHLRPHMAGKDGAEIELRAGEIKWMTGGFLHTLMSEGQDEAKFITLEFQR
jgi:quercetin dioxygenase-like cupin family protein